MSAGDEDEETNNCYRCGPLFCNWCTKQCLELSSSLTSVISSEEKHLAGMVVWCLILLVIFAVTIQVRSQLDPNGFLSIDCGLSANYNYTSPRTKLIYISDVQFIDTGVISHLSSNYSKSLPREFLTVRSFPTGIRNCYKLRSLKIGFKYLIRALFYYGNYDNLNEPPIFDIYLGVNFWDTVKYYSFYTEIMVHATADYLEVCLVQTGHGIPFISSLHLRQLKGTHPFVNSTQSLVLKKRLNVGQRKVALVRYPDDMNDRWWWNYTYSGWKEVSTKYTIRPDTEFEIPSLVMQTAATTSSTQQPLNLYWSSDVSSTKYYFILHFSEILTSATGLREFDILINGIKAFDRPIILQTSYWTTHWRAGFTEYNVSLVATSNSPLPPILNAFELYIVAPGVGVSTYSMDVAAINSVKKYHNIKKGWSGDPCLPTQFLWTGITCTTDSNITRITGLNLSSSSLTGSLCDSIGNLTALEYLYLSNNNLSGSLPSSLDNLRALKFLDIRGNPNIWTTLPPELQRKEENKSLNYRINDRGRTTKDEELAASRQRTGCQETDTVAELGPQYCRADDANF